MNGEAGQGGGGDRQDPSSGAIAGLHELLGYSFTEWQEGRVVGELLLGPQHLNRAGILHGGVLCTMIDAACGAAGLYSADPARRRTSVTLSLNTIFTGQARGGLIRVTAWQRTGGRQIYTSAAEVRNEAGELLAHGHGTFRWLHGSGRSEVVSQS